MDFIKRYENGDVFSQSELKEFPYRFDVIDNSIDPEICYDENPKDGKIIFEVEDRLFLMEYYSSTNEYSQPQEVFLKSNYEFLKVNCYTSEDGESLLRTFH